ncbi:hypothetical protein SAY86_016828 [Trapa natans]|uniref:Transmembrane protein n=1 Tax=Trapa natans TaxID=22666 RepID=A0AAN7LR51_TRANT|nr:hypothetical protein SAY86_016828 [Trapa natans]
MEVPPTTSIPRPICRFRYYVSPYLMLGTSKSKPTSFPCSNSVNVGGFDLFSGRRRVSVQSKIGKGAAFSSHSIDGDDGVRVFEQEAFISNNSGGNCSHFMTDGFNAILNRMYWSWTTLVLEAFNSLLWVRVIIILGAVWFGIGFLLHVIRNRLMDER